MPIQKNQVNGPISSPDTRSGAFARSDERPSLDELIARADSESREHGRREVAAARLAEFDASDAYRRSREDLLALVGPIVDVLPTMEGYQREKVMDAFPGYPTAVQEPQMGTGHAVLCAKPVVGDEPFGVMLADDLVDAPSSCIGQLTAVREARGGGSVIAVQDVAPEATNKYGIVSVDDTSLQTSQMRGIVEKPDPKVAPSRMAVIGRYVFEPEVFDYLEKVTVGVGGEIQLTDGIASSLDTVPTYAHRFEGTRFDCGSKQGFLDATIHFARKRGFRIG